MAARSLARVIAAGALVCAAGCGVLEKLVPNLDSALFDETGLPVGAGLGEACEADADCVSGRVCEGGVCAAAGASGEGERCWATVDCGTELYCDGGKHTCQPAGDASEGEACATISDCQHGLVCAVEGLGLACQASTGTTDIARACEESSECLAGLSCARNPVLDLSEAELSLVPVDLDFDADLDAERVCLPASANVGVPQWDGVPCKEVPEDAPMRAYFEMPDNDDDGDFYRLPFPNDVRRKRGGGLDLSGHPTAGNLIGFDFAQMYFDVAETELDGFSTNPTVYFRFSHRYDPSTVDAESVLFFNLDADNGIYGQSEAREWKVSSGHITKYLCPNWLSVSAPHGVPLRGGQQYAVVLTKAVRPSDGGTFGVSPALTALLDDAPPGDPDLRRAHPAYGPLRDLITAGHLDRNAILNATVFTTQQPEAKMPKLREVIRERAAPALHDLTLCQGATRSPCDDDETRVCQNARGLVELHGRITLPVFQHGTPPYETPQDGGGIRLDRNGRPEVARSEEVCFALTLPATGEMPAQGYPLVIFGHGTGGSFTGAIRNDVAATAAMSSAATLSIDLPQHGSRKAGSEESSEDLFFNFLNPLAARDNVAQGAADLMSLVYWAEQFEAEARDTPVGQPIRFDSERLVLYGHSQGSTHGALMLPHEPGLSAAVFSGLGGDLGLGLTTKRAPVDIASVVPTVLLDPEAAAPSLCQPGFNCVGASHPVLAILQTVFDAVDPVNYGHGIASPPPGGTLKHVLQTVGQRDTFSPEPTMLAYGRSTRMPLAAPERFEWSGVPVADDAVSLNVSMLAGEGPDQTEVFATQAILQFRPSTSEDGHFVAFDEGADQVADFLNAVLTGQDPVVGR